MSQYFDDGTAAFLTPPCRGIRWRWSSSEYCHIDSMNALHCVSRGHDLHPPPPGGGLTWDTMNHSLDGVASSIESNSKPAPARTSSCSTCATRTRRSRRGHAVARAALKASARHPDLPRTGRPRLDLGRGNDIRFDFASLGILLDGGVVVAYHDSTHEIRCGRVGPARLKCLLCRYSLPNGQKPPV